MQTTTSEMIADLSAVLNQKTSKFIGFYDQLTDLQDASATPADGLQAIVINPSEFYYHAIGGSWVRFAPVGEVHPTYVGAYDNTADLNTAYPNPSDGDISIIGKSHFYIYDSGRWDQLITPASGTETAQVTKNTADITALKSTVAGFDQDPPGIDQRELENNELSKWDEAQKKMVGTGIYSNQDGEMDISPDSLLFGGHKMSAAVEDVTFTNTETNKAYAPLWQEVKADNKEGYIRETESEEDVVRVPEGDEILINPTNRTTVDHDELFFGGTFTLAEPCADLVFEFHGVDTGRLLWRFRGLGLSAGTHEIRLPVAQKLKASQTYDFKIYSQSGEAKLKGTGGQFSWIIQRAKFFDKPIATREWTTNQLTSFVPSSANGLLVTGLDITNGKLAVHYSNGTTQELALPESAPSGAPVDLAPLQQELTTLKQKLTAMGVNIQDLTAKYGALNHQISQIGKVYAYRGSSQPAYPSDTRAAYFVTLSQATGNRMSLRLPKPADDLLDGTLFMLVNENYQTAVLINAQQDGYTISDSDSLNVPPNNQFALLVKMGSNWEKIAGGFIPSSMLSIVGSVRSQVIQDLQSDTPMRQAVETDFNNFLANKLSDQDTLDSLATSLDPFLSKLGFTKGGDITPSAPSAPIAPAHRPADSGSMVETFTTWGDDYPTSLSGAVRSDSGQVTVDRETTDAEHVYIAVPYDDGSKITAIGRVGGIPSVWPSKDVTIQNRPWRVFKSPNLLYEQQATYQIYVR